MVLSLISHFCGVLLAIVQFSVVFNSRKAVYFLRSKLLELMTALE